jgi:translation initiation factor 3 subunit I
MAIATTPTSKGKFEARFYHLIFEEEFARVKGHFGPINSLAFNPKGTQYTSGAEDGFLRVHNFDSSYFDYKFDFFV